MGDLVDGILLSSEKVDRGIHGYFIGGEKDAYTWNQISEITAKVLGKKALHIRLKADWVKKLAAVIENTASVFGIYPVVNKEKANEMILEWVCSSDKARKE